MKTHEEPELKFGPLPEKNEVMDRMFEQNVKKYIAELDAEAKALERQAALKRHVAETLHYLYWKNRSLQDRLDIVTKAKNGVD
jgi:oligoribonuclease NrnB/cAMP/cGMP phosphodiesterase (DHH superfamily)